MAQSLSSAASLPAAVSLPLFIARVSHSRARVFDWGERLESCYSAIISMASAMPPSAAQVISPRMRRSSTPSSILLRAAMRQASARCPDRLGQISGRLDLVHAGVFLISIEDRQLEIRFHRLLRQRTFAISAISRNSGARRCRRDTSPRSVRRPGHARCAPQEAPSQSE